MVKTDLGRERVKLRAPSPTSWLRLILEDKDKQQNDQQKSDDTTTDVHVASPFKQVRHHPPNLAGCLAGAARSRGQRAALKQEDEQHDHQDERDCPDADVHAAPPAIVGQPVRALRRRCRNQAPACPWPLSRNHRATRNDPSATGPHRVARQHARVVSSRVEAVAACTRQPAVA